MPSDAPGILALILQLLQQLSEWLKVVPREPSRAEHIFDVGFPVAIGAAFGLMGVWLGNRHQAMLRERDEIAEAWDGPLASLRAAVDDAQWPSPGFMRSRWATYTGRWESIEPARAAYYSARSHRLHRFIDPDTLAVAAWLQAERDHNFCWAMHVPNSAAEHDAALAYLLDNPLPDAGEEIPRVEVERAISLVGTQPTDSRIESTLRLITDPIARLEIVVVAEGLRLSEHEADSKWHVAARSLQDASARGAPEPGSTWMNRIRMPHGTRRIGHLAE